jgi:hypothetical protein
MIQGKNKLKSEIDSIHNNKDKGLMIYKDFAQFETQFIETMEEEVIAMDYDRCTYL